MGHRASQKLAMEHARQFDVIGINCSAGGFFTPIGARNIFANYCVLFTHGESSSVLFIEFVGFIAFLEFDVVTGFVEFFEIR